MIGVYIGDGTSYGWKILWSRAMKDLLALNQRQQIKGMLRGEAPADARFYDHAGMRVLQRHARLIEVVEKENGQRFIYRAIDDLRDNWQMWD